MNLLQNRITVCYLCGEKLNSNSTPDHIIPNQLFGKHAPYRPKLPVHHKCNNLKSKDDEWFVKQVQLRSSINPEAEQEFSLMIEKAKIEKPDAYIIGKKLHNYKLAKGMFNKISWGLELPYQGKGLIQMKLEKDDVIRFQRYIETMCRGLFIRNVEFSNPSKPELIVKQYADLEIRGKEKYFVDTVKNLIDMSKESKFGQYWGNKITYIGSRVKETPDKGFLFVQFYSQFGILAVFR